MDEVLALPFPNAKGTNILGTDKNLVTIIEKIFSYD